MIVVTHYQRLLNYIVPDFVHVLADGRIVKSGGKELALELEETGYAGHAKRGRRKRMTAAAASQLCSNASAEGLRRPAFRRAGLPDHARRGLALHQRGAHRPRDVRARK